MAFFDYKCENGHVHEEMRSHTTRDDASTCPECGEPAKPIFSGSPRSLWFPDSGRQYTERKKIPR